MMIVVPLCYAFYLLWEHMNLFYQASCMGISLEKLKEMKIKGKNKKKNKESEVEVLESDESVDATENVVGKKLKEEQIVQPNKVTRGKKKT